MSLVTPTTAGARQIISVGVCDATAQSSSPTVTTELPAPPTVRCSKPWPLTVTSVPPPAEPSAGVMAVMATTYSNVMCAPTSAHPMLGTCTATGTKPGGALDATHDTSERSLGASTTLTLAQTPWRPSVTVGVAPGGMRSIVRVRLAFA